VQLPGVDTVRRLLGAAFAVWLAAAALALAQETDPVAAFKARIDAAAAQMDTDLGAAVQALDRLATESVDMRRTKPLTAAERPAHRQLFLLAARAHLQLLDNKKVEENFRELLRVDPLFAGDLSPREQEVVDTLRKRETGFIEVTNPERGAHVLVDGSDLGTIGDAPVRLSVLAGNYEVRLEKPGFKTAATRVTVVVGQTQKVGDLVLTRNVPPIVFFTDRDDVEVLADNVTIGRTAKLAALRRQVPPEDGAELDRLAASSGIDAQAVAGILLRDPAVDRAVTVRFQRECLVEETRTVTLTPDALAKLDPAQAFIWLADTAVLKMRPDAGTLRITSTPPDADVFVDGQLVGRTPFDRDVCSGSHRVRVRHRIGSYNITATISRGRTEVVDVTLKPDLAFIGAVDTVQGTLRPSPELTTTVDRALASAVTSFHLASRLDLPPEIQRWTDTSVASLVTAEANGDRDGVERLLKQAITNFDASLMLCAVRRPAEGGGEAPLDLLVFWSEHAVADTVRISSPSETLIAAALQRINAPADAIDLVYRPDLGIRVADTSLPDAPLVVSSVRAGSSAAIAGIKAGDAIEAVDQSAANAAQFANRLRRKQPGDPMAIRVTSPGGTPRDVQVPAQRRARQAPAFDSTLPGNGLIAKLSARIPVATGSERDLLNFSLALTSMRFGEWRRALDLLAALTSPPGGEGVGRGAVLFFRARCYEELGEPDRALALYKEAAAIDDEELFGDGATVGAVARYRLATLAGAASKPAK
jgi:hypothetical protein